MYKVLITVISVFHYLNIYSECANILVIIPTPFFSHQSSFRQLWKDLSLRGHQVTLVTTHPMKNDSLTNLTEIDISFSRKISEENGLLEIMSDNSKPFYQKLEKLIHIAHKTMGSFFGYPDIQKLLKDKNVHYDLLITEALYPFMVSFSWRFKCPCIGVASLDVNFFIYEALGNPLHPILVPDYNSIIEDYHNLSLKERFLEVFFRIVQKISYKLFMFPALHKRMQEYFGSDLPSLEDLHYNISMLFVNMNPLIHNIRPLSPNIKMVGSGMHIEPPKKLPEDIKAFLDNAENGAIYFSLGSNIQSNLVKEDLQKVFIETFREIPYRVLWRFDLKGNESISKNVLVREWFPQQDILRHPNVKLFITQGGLQSLEEALTFGAPIIGIPFFGDQFHNVKKAVELGIGKEIKVEKIDKVLLKRSIQEIMTNSRYRERTAELGKILHDRPMKGTEEAVWWTEYVLRHRGAKYLKSHLNDIPFYQYYLLDIIALLLLISFVILYFIYIIFRVIKFLVKRRKNKTD